MGRNRRTRRYAQSGAELFSPGRSEGIAKDSSHNALPTDEFTIKTVDEQMAEPMNLALGSADLLTT